ncbi:unnamed protein product, partial [Choristocarpus tenellus]
FYSTCVRCALTGLGINSKWGITGVLTLGCHLIYLLSAVLIPHPLRQSDNFPMVDHFVVGVAGGSGSGKTTLTRALVDVLGKDSVTHLCHDSYYRDLSHLPLAQRRQTNFDHPRSLETSLLVQHLKELKGGQTVDIPVYDFTVHSRTSRTERTPPRKVILLEGILIFSDPDLVDLMDMKIFVDTVSG